MSTLTIFSGSAHRDLAGSIARLLNVPLGKSTTERFPDGEISVCLGEPVRGREVFIVQHTSPSVNDHLVELLAIIDACRRSRRNGLRRSCRILDTHVRTNGTAGASRLPRAW